MAISVSDVGASEVEALQQHQALIAQAAHAEACSRFVRAVRVGTGLWVAFVAGDVVALHSFGSEASWIAVIGPRVGGVLVLLAVLAWTNSLDIATPRRLVALDQFIYTQASMWIGIMCISLGGLTSPYLSGACLVLTARTFSLPQQWRPALLSNLLPATAAPLTVLVGVALVPELRSQLRDRAALGAFFMDVVHLLGTAVLMATASHIVSTLRSEISANKDVGRYRLRRRIGLGGMGEVWAAWHSGLKREVALKILRGVAGENNAAARFEREVRATVELSHPNTIRIFDYGATADGILFYAMELLDGENLATLVSRVGPLIPSRAVYLVLQAARSLAEAHARGIVHRDIKPENLFVTSAGGVSDFIKVLDFGIAHVEASEHDVKLTAHDAIVGTPRYMAPEALRGSKPTAGADVYALGAVLYLCLVGTPPFDMADKSELVTSILSPEPARRVETANVSSELVNVVARALSKNPAERFENAAQLRDALSAVPEASLWKPADLEPRPLRLETDVRDNSPGVVPSARDSRTVTIHR